MKKLLLIVAVTLPMMADDIDNANKAFQDQRYPEALRLYKKLCEDKDAKACASLAYMYQSGKGVKADLKESGKYYKRACDLGNKESCANAGWN